MAKNTTFTRLQELATKVDGHLQEFMGDEGSRSELAPENYVGARTKRKKRKSAVRRVAAAGAVVGGVHAAKNTHTGQLAVQHAKNVTSGAMAKLNSPKTKQAAANVADKGLVKVGSLLRKGAAAAAKGRKRLHGFEEGAPLRKGEQNLSGRFGNILQRMDALRG
jgi:hypothetical protein